MRESKDLPRAEITEAEAQGNGSQAIKLRLNPGEAQEPGDREKVLRQILALPAVKKAIKDGELSVQTLKKCSYSRLLRRQKQLLGNMGLRNGGAESHAESFVAVAIPNEVTASQSESMCQDGAGAATSGERLILQVQERWRKRPLTMRPRDVESGQNQGAAVPKPTRRMFRWQQR